MKIDITRKDVVWSYIGTFMNTGIEAVMLPFIMYYLNDDMLGMWFIFASVGAIATLFDFGFEVTFSRNIAYCWTGARELKKENVSFTEYQEPNYALLKRVLETCRVVYGIIAGVAFLLLITIGMVYIIFVGRELEGNVHIISWIIYSISIFLNLYFGYYASFLRGVGDVTDANKSLVFSKLIELLLLLLFLVMGLGLVGVCISMLANGLMYRMLAKHYAFKYQNIGEKFKKVTVKSSRQQIHDMFLIVWHNAWRDGVISISNYLCSQASVIIASLYLSLSETGAYSLGIQIAAAVSTFASTLYGTYQPEIQSAYVAGDKKRLKEVMSMIVISFIYLFIAGVIFAVFIGIPILRFIKSSVILPVTVLLGLSFYQFVLQFRDCYGSYFSSTNRIPYLKAYVISSVLCVLLSLIGIGVLSLGIWGLIIAQILSQVVYNFWKWPLSAHRELEMSVGETFKNGNLALLQRFFLNNKEINR